MKGHELGGSGAPSVAVCTLAACAGLPLAGAPQTGLPLAGPVAEFIHITCWPGLVLHCPSAASGAAPPTAARLDHSQCSHHILTILLLHIFLLFSANFGQKYFPPSNFLAIWCPYGCLGRTFWRSQAMDLDLVAAW